MPAFSTMPISTPGGTVPGLIDAEMRRRDEERKRKEQERQFLSQNIQQGVTDARGRQAPQVAGTTIAPVQQMDTARSDQLRNAQLDLLNRYQAVAAGQQQGAGELAAQRQAQRALGNVAGAATLARGNSAIGGARAAARGAGAIGLGAAGQAQQAALTDQQAARQALLNLTGQAREQDIGIAGANMSAENQRIFQQAGIDQTTSLENARMKLQQMGLNDAMITNMLGMLNQQRIAEMSRPQSGFLGSLLTNAGPILAGIGAL